MTKRGENNLYSIKYIHSIGIISIKSSHPQILTSSIQCLKQVAFCPSICTV